MNFDQLGIRSQTERDVAFTLKYSRRKTIGIYVSAERGIEVRVPHFVSRQEAMAFVATKKEWIEKQLQAIAARPSRFEPEFNWGGRFYFLGEPLRFHHQEHEDVDLVLSGNAGDDAQRIERKVQGWFRSQALELFGERHEHWRERMSDFNLPLSTVQIRAMKRRWGTCRRSGQIILNTNLARYPLNCVDVVIVHELCHLLEFNHSPRFYQRMTQVIPDWKRHDKMLNELSQRY